MSNTLRSERFNDTTGAFGYWTANGPTSAAFHPDRCVCQGTDPTPHKHYRESPHRCARCSACDRYRAATILRLGQWVTLASE
jgi:hypothetical protein